MQTKRRARPRRKGEESRLALARSREGWANQYSDKRLRSGPEAGRGHGRWQQKAAKVQPECVTARPMAAEARCARADGGAR